MDTDRIEKTILLHAKRSRVWRALTDSKQFGEWFGMKFEAPFEAGKPIHGLRVPSTIDPDRSVRPHDGKPVEWKVDRIEPERLFSLRWVPLSGVAGEDYSQEPMTLVTFVLEEQPGGTLLTVTESGFDRIPLARRAEAFKAHDGGWSIQVERIQQYLANAS